MKEQMARRTFYIFPQQAEHITKEAKKLKVTRKNGKKDKRGQESLIVRELLTKSIQ